MCGIEVKIPINVEASLINGWLKYIWQYQGGRVLSKSIFFLFSQNHILLIHQGIRGSDSHHVNYINGQDVILRKKGETLILRESCPSTKYEPCDDFLFDQHVMTFGKLFF